MVSVAFVKTSARELDPHGGDNCCCLGSRRCCMTRHSIHFLTVKCFNLLISTVTNAFSHTSAFFQYCQCCWCLVTYSYLHSLACFIYLTCCLCSFLGSRPQAVAHQHACSDHSVLSAIKLAS